MFFLILKIYLNENIHKMHYLKDLIVLLILVLKNAQMTSCTNKFG